jgi:phosphoinositide-3-kinase regulatory subunit 4
MFDDRIRLTPIRCCLIELFTEGKVPFDLSQLLSFCSNKYYPQPVIDSIEDPIARELVTHMIQQDPTLRAPAEEYLTRFRGILFPEVFYTTLQSYFVLLAFQPLSKPDSRIARLRHDIK